MNNNIIIINGKTVPFQIGQTVYVIDDEIVSDGKIWIPPDYTLGGDIDGPFDRGHYQKKFHYEKIVKKTKFCFALLDKYDIDEIYDDKETANWKLLLLNKQNKTKGVIKYERY